MVIINDWFMFILMVRISLSINYFILNTYRHLIKTNEIIKIKQESNRFFYLNLDNQNINNIIFS